MENETLNGACKRMYERCNKKGPTLMLLMLRCAELQHEVLDGLVQLTGQGTRTKNARPPTDCERSDLPLLAEEEEDEDNAFFLSPGVDLQRACGGWSCTAATLEAVAPELGDVSASLGVEEHEVLTVARSVSFPARFECGAASKVQIARETSLFRVGLWYDVVRYINEADEVSF